MALPHRTGFGRRNPPRGRPRYSDGRRNMKFENDIFVSYAHIDDQPLMEGQKGWISSFHRVLEIRLGQLLGRHPRIWRDPKLQGNDIFADRLVERLPEDRDPRVDRLPSLREVRLVHARAPGVLEGLGDDGRHADREQGAGLQDREDAGPPRAADPRVPGRPRVRVLRGRPRHRAGRASCRRPATRSRRGSTGPSSTTSPTTWPSSSRRSTRRTGRRWRPGRRPSGSPSTSRRRPTTCASSATRSAGSSGYDAEVLPDRPLPLVGPECREAVREQLARSALSIHLIGRELRRSSPRARPGRPSSCRTTSRSSGAPAAASAASSGCPEDLESEDERQVRFIDTLQTDARIQAGADILQTSLSDFKAVIQRRLRPPEPPKEKETAARRPGAAAPGGDRT